MAAFWTRRENKVGMVITIACFFGGLAYFIFKLARMYQKAKEQYYLPARKNLTSFAVITILMIILTIINACVCMSNFDKGLKPHVLKRKIGGEEEKADDMTELPDLKYGQGQVPSRMVIDWALGIVDIRGFGWDGLSDYMPCILKWLRISFGVWIIDHFVLASVAYQGCSYPMAFMASLTKELRLIHGVECTKCNLFNKLNDCKDSGVWFIWIKREAYEFKPQFSCLCRSGLHNWSFIRSISIKSVRCNSWDYEIYFSTDKGHQCHGESPN